MKIAPSARALSITAIFLVLLFGGCGKKGAPTLKSYEKPAAASDLTVTDRENSIYLSWSFPRDKEITVESLLVLRAEGGDFTKIAGTKSSARTYIDRDIRPGRQYRYKVLAKNQRGVFSNDSNIAAITPQEVPQPPRPVFLRITGTSLELRWQEPGSGLLYNVYKSGTSGSYGLVPVNTSPLTSPLFTDSLDLGKKVYYTIRSLTDRKTLNESSASEEITVDPEEFVPGPPSAVRHFESESRVYLTWDEPGETWVTGFRVFRSIGGGEYLLIGKPQAPAFIDADASPGERSYRVHAVGPGREGPGVEIRGIRLLEGQP